MGVLALEVLERVEVPGGRVPRLGAGDVEAGDPAVAPGDRQLGDLAGAGLVAHGGQQLADDDPAAGWPAIPSSKPRWTAATTSSSVQPSGDVLLGGVAHLGVHDAVVGQVLDALAGDPGQRVGLLHHRDGVVERLEVALQRPGVRRLGEPAAQRVGVRRPGSSWPISAASSTIVCGRSPPSRWSCSSALGARAICSRVAGSRSAA